MSNDIAALVKQLPEVQGQSPQPAPEEPLVLIVCEAEDITNGAMAYAANALAHLPTARFHIHALNADVTDRAHLSILKSVNPGIKITVTFESVPKTLNLSSYREKVQFARCLAMRSMANALTLLVQPSAGTTVGRPNTNTSTEETSFPNAIMIDHSMAATRALGRFTALGLEALFNSPSQVSHDHRPYAWLVTDPLTEDGFELWERMESADVEEKLIYFGGSTAPLERAWQGDQSSHSGMRVVILKPDFGLPFRPLPLLPHDAIQRLRASYESGDQAALRRHWARAMDFLAEAFRKEGHRVFVTDLPMPDLTPEFANALDADLAIVPHKQTTQFPGLNMPALFLMQIAHKWLFTLDPKGWGAGAAAYGSKDFEESPADSGAYENYAERLLSTNESKFSQPGRVNAVSLREKGELPDGDYIFFPCQIPHDEVIQFFSPYKEEEVVSALSEWANRTQTPIVMKLHPANRAATEPLVALTKKPYVIWSEGNIHDLIGNAQAVYTINSGVGHEAILHGKPLVTFGKVEYDVVSIRATLETLDEAYQSVRTWRFEEQVPRYKQFVHWFVREYGLDLDYSEGLEGRLRALVKLGEGLVATQR